MTSSLTLLVWVTVAATSLLLCTRASVHSSPRMTSSGHSRYEVDQQGRVYRGGQRDAPTAEEGGRRGLYYDLAGGKGRDDDLQAEGRFAERGHGDLEAKSWPARGDENVLRQQYVAEDPGSERFNAPHLLNYDDGVELLQGDLDSTSEEVDSQKNKRESHSLSIVNPLDVLRQRLMLDLATRKMKQNQEQIKANDLILKTLGKRSLLGQSSGRTALTSKDYLSRHQDSTAEDFNL